MKIINIVGARPNFMKIAPIQRQMEESSKIEPILVHTGQHYDERMSKIFFEDLGLPNPDVYLGVGSGSHAVQTAKIMIEFEKVLMKYSPDMVLVVGDVNSTIACALVAVKMGISVTHVEAGLRSFDASMPEEINRKITDSISDFLFVSEKSGIDNLINEGINQEKIYFVGNVMIDSLINHLENARKSNIINKIGLNNKRYGLVTLHRPSNVDSKDKLIEIFNTFDEIQKKIAIVFPVHPRTIKKIQDFGLESMIGNMPNLHLIDPVGYLDFLKLMSCSELVITDSGGIQEETTFLNVPCITLRDNTERPITIDIGTNQLVKINKQAIIKSFNNIKSKNGEIPELWDGQTAERIVNILESI